MTDGDALYRAVCEHPADDTPRLVYADWLDENGRPEEAEFVRVECALEADGPGHPEYAERTVRRDELRLWLEAHVPAPGRRFPGGLELVGGWENTRRGFPREVRFTERRRTGPAPAGALAADLEEAFAATPARRLKVFVFNPAQLAELLRHPVVGQLDALYLVDPAGAGPETAAVLAACPRLANLRELVLNSDPGESGSRALAESPHLARVEEFAGGRHWTPEMVRAFAAAGWFRRLRSMTVLGEPPELFVELCRAGTFPRLHTLRLYLMSPARWRALARSDGFPALARLEADRLDPAGWAALARARWLRPARVEMTYAGQTDAGATALAAARWFRSVRWLDLSNNSIGPAGVGAVVGGRAAGLRVLNLAGNPVGADGLRAVARSPALRGLLALHLTGGESRGLTPTHLHEFLSALDLPHLRYLDLYGLPVGGRAARLLTADRFRSLTRLNLSGCRLTDKAVAALLAAPALQNLIELDLSANGLRDGVAALADPAVMPRLSACHLRGNRIGRALAKRIARPGLVT